MGVSFAFCVLAIQGATMLVVGQSLKVPGLDETEYSIPGDINVAVSQYVYGYSGEGFCNPDDFDLPGVLKTEVIHYITEEINAREDLLPNITLGFIIQDDCQKSLTALARATRLVSKTTECADDPGPVNYKNTSSIMDARVVGVVGPMYSGQSVMVSGFLGLYHIPVLATYATSDELADKSRFEYFMRMVPPDAYQSRALVDILLHFGWTYVSFLYSEGNYGENGARQIEGRLKTTDICVAYTRRISSKADEEEYDDVARGLLANRKAKVVLTFLFSHRIAQALWRAMERQASMDTFIWIGSDTMPDAFVGNDAAMGSIAIGYSLYPTSGAAEFIKSLPCSPSQNPWLSKFCNQIFSCDSTRPCSPDAKVGDGGLVDDLIERELAFGIWSDGVLVYAHALHNLIQAKCPNAFVNKDLVRECLGMTSGDELLESMRNVSFRGSVGDISFNAVGERYGRYAIIQATRDQEGNARKREIGYWSLLTDSLTIDKALEWKEKHLLQNKTVHLEVYPESVCSYPCGPREYYHMQELPCCWDCRICRENERIIDNGTGCNLCDQFTWPDEETATYCIELPHNYLAATNPIGLALVTITGIVLLFSLAILLLFLKNSNRKLIKATSRELSFIILCGTILACVVSFVYIVKPSDIVCKIRSVGFHFAVVLIYAPLAMKSIRIYRIFAASLKGLSKPKFTSTKVQIVFAMIALLMQVSLPVKFLLGAS